MRKTLTHTDDGHQIYEQLLETYEPETAEGASLKIEVYDETEAMSKKEVMSNAKRTRREVS